MRSFRKTVLIAVVLCATLLAAVFGCKKTPTTPQNPTPEPPEPPASEYAYTIIGASDYYVDISATAESLDLSQVYAVRSGSDTEYEVNADFSAVSFGVKGKYSVVYSCGSAQAEKSVYVYSSDAPEISGAESKTVGINYDPLTGVSAKDQFGFSVTVDCAVYSGGVKTDTLQNGENTVKYTASDLSGNKATVTVILTVA